MMVRLHLFVILLFCSAWTCAQSVVVNPDGTHSIATGNVVVNPNGTHSIISGSVVVNPDGSVGVVAGPAIINPDGTHSSVVGSPLLNSTPSDISSPVKTNETGVFDGLSIWKQVSQSPGHRKSQRSRKAGTARSATVDSLRPPYLAPLIDLDRVNSSK